MDRKRRFVTRAEPGRGWRVWDNQQKRWWGPAFTERPEAVLAELNAKKRPERLAELLRSAT